MISRKYIIFQRTNKRSCIVNLAMINYKFVFFYLEKQITEVRDIQPDEAHCTPLLPQGVCSPWLSGNRRLEWLELEREE